MSRTHTDDILIDGLATDGRGAARIGGKVYFIPGALPGDRLRVQLDDETKPPSGEILALIEPSPHRVEHPCPHAGLCTASPWGWFSYEKQLEHKRALTERTLRKAMGEVIVLPAIASPSLWHYRNRLMLTVWTEDNHLRLGYQRNPRTNEGIAVRTCKLGANQLDALLHRVAIALEGLDLSQLKRTPRRIQVHETANGAGLLLVFLGPVSDSDIHLWEKYLKSASAAGGIWFAQGTQAGIVAPAKSVRKTPDAIPMRVMWRNHAINLHPTAFTQANPAAADLVLARLQKFAGENSFDAVWDLYGGYGALGFALAGANHPINVLEISNHAERAFQELGALVGNTTRKFFRGDLLKTLPQHAPRITAADVLIMDPPRSGSHPEVIRVINESPIKRVIYLSCNPARLGRDMSQFHHGGFAPVEIQPYDFFPQTPATEVLAILQR